MSGRLHGSHQKAGPILDNFYTPQIKKALLSTPPHTQSRKRRLFSETEQIGYSMATVFMAEANPCWYDEGITSVPFNYFTGVQYGTAAALIDVEHVRRRVLSMIGSMTRINALCLCAESSRQCGCVDRVLILRILAFLTVQCIFYHAPRYLCWCRVDCSRTSLTP